MHQKEKEEVLSRLSNVPLAVFNNDNPVKRKKTLGKHSDTLTTVKGKKTF